MALFQLDPQSIAARIRASGDATPVPTLAASVFRGLFGFTLVSVAGFSPWAIFEQWFHSMREMDLYVACLAVLVGLSGVFLHRLIIGPGSMPRFYKLFSLAFAAYAIVWVAFWIWLRDESQMAGVLGGTAAMGAILAFAFDAQRSIVKIIASLFIPHALGYWAGGWFEGHLAIHHRLAGMMLWAVCYGIGLGAGLGLAFHLCQQRARAILHTR